jgi:ABC-type sugar transport system ATPase subunit
MTNTDPDLVAIRIAGRETQIRRPKPGQLLGIQMVTQTNMSMGQQMQLLTDLFLGLLLNDDDKNAFIVALATGEQELAPFVNTLVAIANYEPVPAAMAVAPKAAPVKRVSAAKKTTARKRVAPKR